MGWTDEPQVHYMVEYRGGLIFAVHLITIPGLFQKGGRVQILSLGGFRNRESARGERFRHEHRYAYPGDRERPRWFYEKDALSWQIEKDVGFPDIYKDKPHFEHPDLWAFYKAIGYDHKKNKLINPWWTRQVVRSKVR